MSPLRSDHSSQECPVPAWPASTLGAVQILGPPMGPSEKKQRGREHRPAEAQAASWFLRDKPLPMHREGPTLVQTASAMQASLVGLLFMAGFLGGQPGYSPWRGEGSALPTGPPASPMFYSLVRLRATSSLPFLQTLNKGLRRSRCSCCM